MGCQILSFSFYINIKTKNKILKFHITKRKHTNYTHKKILKQSFYIKLDRYINKYNWTNSHFKDYSWKIYLLKKKKMALNQSHWEVWSKWMSKDTSGKYRKSRAGAVKVSSVRTIQGKVLQRGRKFLYNWKYSKDITVRKIYVLSTMAPNYKKKKLQ